ncbi:phospholipase-like protein [Tanacetum coccineum]
MVQKQHKVDEYHNDMPLIYYVEGHSLHFDRPEFALITGMRFGTISFCSYTFADLKFRNRVFLNKVGLVVTNLDVLGVIKDEVMFGNLCDEDSVRLCLILALEVIFMGRLLTCLVDDSLFRLVENLEACNVFSMGGAWSLVTHTWIAKRYFKQLIQNPHISIRTMQADIMRKYKCKVSTGQCSRAKKKTLHEYEGGLKEHYARLSDYGTEIMETNPGSTVKMCVNTSDGNNYFSIYYVCFKGVKDGCGSMFKNLFWAAAKSTTEQHFEDKMNQIKAISNDAYNHLVERNPKSWSRAFFEVDKACDSFENGMSKSFNSRILVARRKPIITMLEDIRTYVMLRNFKKAKKVEKLEHEVCPSIRKKLEDIKVEQRHWSVIPSDYNVFEARNEYNAYFVALLSQQNPKLVCEWLKKDMFKEAYKYPIRPLKDSSFCPKTDDIKPLPPKERRMPGRPCVNRKRGACEKDRKNAKVGFGRKMTCQKCYGKGHNSRSCKKQKTNPPPKDVRPKGRSKIVVAPTSERASTSGIGVCDEMVGQ